MAGPAFDPLFRGLEAIKNLMPAGNDSPKNPRFPPRRVSIAPVPAPEKRNPPSRPSGKRGSCPAQSRPETLRLRGFFLVARVAALVSLVAGLAFGALFRFGLGGLLLQIRFGRLALRVGLLVEIDNLIDF